MRLVPQGPRALLWKKRKDTKHQSVFVFLCFFQAACWHSAPQYQACLQTGQRLSAVPCFPQWVQLAWSSRFWIAAANADISNIAKRKQIHRQNLAIIRIMFFFCRTSSSVPVSPYGGSLKNLRDLKHLHWRAGSSSNPKGRMSSVTRKEEGTFCRSSPWKGEVFAHAGSLKNLRTPKLSGGARTWPVQAPKLPGREEEFPMEHLGETLYPHARRH